MKKILIVCIALAMLVSLFAVSVSAEQTREHNWGDVEEVNVASLSAIIKILLDNGYNVSTTAPYESESGLIQISPAISSGTTLSSDVTVKDLIPGYPFGVVYSAGDQKGDLKEQREEVDFYRYYVCHFNVRGESREADPFVSVYAGDVCFGGSDYSVCGGVELENADAVISLHFDRACTAIDEFTIVRSSDYDDSFAGYFPENWLPSVDYRTGYAYTAEEPDEPASTGTAADAGDVKPLSLIPKQADLPKVRVFVRIALIGALGVALVFVAMKFLRPVGARMRQRKR